MTASGTKKEARTEPGTPRGAETAGGTAGQNKAPVKPKRYLRRHKDPYTIIAQVKLWPSKTGVLHGIRSVKLKGGMIEATTHCGQTIKLRNSKNGRLARHLRNKIYERPCRRCRIPAWKLEKFEDTSFV